MSTYAIYGALRQTIRAASLIVTFFSTGCLRSQQGVSAMSHQASLDAGCPILGVPAGKNQDALSRLLSGTGKCPRNVLAFRQALIDAGLSLTTNMVANRGFHNPRRGSFILFEMANGTSTDGHIKLGDGDLFFGHFTTANDRNELILNPAASEDDLTIELIAWDPVKEVYNFYELTGQDEQGKWSYRGDSLDILADNVMLHRQTDPLRPKFGQRLRCSGCHSNGGPIMKELSPPHNDWWRTARKTPFAPNTPDATLSQIVANLSDASVLADKVIIGQEKLRKSKAFTKAVAGKSLQEQLRPLFCPVEVNLASDLLPNDAMADIQVPSAFFVDPRLAAGKLSLQRSFYEQTLKNLGSTFPEIPQKRDGDHAWLTPVKANSDILMVQNLVDAGLIDEEFVADVLAVDFANPVTSTARCQLLKYLPAQVTENWQETFAQALASSSQSFALELASNLHDQRRTAAFHQQKARDFLGQCDKQLQQATATPGLLTVLGQRRLEVYASEISKNPLGQIFEPGFRVIFPQWRPSPKPGEFRLNENCLAWRQRDQALW